MLELLAAIAAHAAVSQPAEDPASVQPNTHAATVAPPSPATNTLQTSTTYKQAQPVPATDPASQNSKAAELLRGPQDKLVASDEDYSGLAKLDRSQLTPWAKLKYIPIGDTSYFSLGGEARTRYEIRDNERFGRGPQDDGGDLQQRFRVWADVHIGGHVRTFVELKNGMEAGYGPTLSFVDRKDIDLAQGFVELSSPLGDVGSVALRIGRQEISIGSFRLFDVRDGLNVRRSLDAARLLFNHGAWNGELLAGHAESETKTPFDNSIDDGFGFYGARLARQFGHSTAEALWIHSDRDHAVYDLGSAVEHRDTFSLHLNGLEDRIAYDIEAIGQTGRWGQDKVLAGYLSASAAYVLPVAMQPKIGATFEIGSGDRHRSDTRMNTYFQLFARPLTLNGELGRSNLTVLGPTFSFQPTRKLTIAGNVERLWRTSTADGIYVGAGTLLRGSQEGMSRDVGMRTTVGGNYLVSRYLTVGAYFNHVSAGRFLKQTGDGKDLNYLAFYSTLRF